jgi:hypothetical protein
VISGDDDLYEASVTLGDGTTAILASGVSQPQAYYACVRHYHGLLESLLSADRRGPLPPGLLGQQLSPTARRTVQAAHFSVSGHRLCCAAVTSCCFHA